MRQIATAFALIFALATTPVLAQSDETAKLDALFDALGMPEIIEIMREEGVEYGTSLGADIMPGGALADWAEAVDTIYDPQMMHAAVRGAFDEALAGDDLDPMLEFFTSGTGARIVALEVSARRALLDDAVEDAGKEAATLQMRERTPRYLRVRDFVEANDLIERNVVGSLNTSYAFFSGLIDGGAMPAGVTHNSALQDVWSQEAEIRKGTTEWIYAFLLMAYQPLSEDELRAYVAFSETAAGRALTSALFWSFDGMLEDIARALGIGASRFMMSREL